MASQNPVQDDINELRVEAWREEILAEDAPEHEAFMRRSWAALCDGAANFLELNRIVDVRHG